MATLREIKMARSAPFGTLWEEGRVSVILKHTKACLLGGSTTYTYIYMWRGPPLEIHNFDSLKDDATSSTATG